MIHLLRLECKKYKIHWALLWSALLIAGCILFITVSLLDSAYDPAQTKDSFDSTFKVIGLLLSFTFLIYSSLLTSRIIIGEYNNKTINILFTYPVNRRLLIMEKLLIVMAITAISVAIGYVCCCSYLYIVDKRWDLLEGSFQTKYIAEWMKSAVVSTIVCTIMSVWPFLIGMMKKSVPATIVSSLLVVIVRQILITSGNDIRTESMAQLVAMVLVTGLCTWFVFQKRVDRIA